MRGALVEPGQVRCKMYVPWPGPYRLQAHLGEVHAQEGAGSGFNAGMNLQPWKGMETSVVVPKTGPTPEATLGEVRQQTTQPR